MRTREKFLVFAAPAIEQPEIDEVVETLRSGWLGTGPRVKRFEEDFARYKGVDPARVVAVSSCTAALHLSLVTAGIGPGDEVITTPLTFCATVNAIIHAGATPVVVDVDAATMNLDPEAVRAALTPRTKAILPVHYAGRPCDMKALLALAKERDLIVIEDCAHAIETTVDGAHAGTLGDFGCFSFYVTKNIVTGEGGMVIARDEETARRLRRLSLHGLSKDAWKRFGSSGYSHYEVVEPGFKYNMMDIQAAIGLHQLQRIEPYWERRRVLWQRYLGALAGLPIELPAPDAAGARHAYHLFTVLIDEQRAGLTRDQMLEAMTRHKIGVGVHYVSMSDQPYYQERFGFDPAKTPVATRVGRQTMSLPLTAALDDADVEDVVAALHAILTPVTARAAEVAP